MTLLSNNSKFQKLFSNFKNHHSRCTRPKPRHSKRTAATSTGPKKSALQNSHQNKNALNHVQTRQKKLLVSRKPRQAPEARPGSGQKQRRRRFFDSEVICKRKTATESPGLDCLTTGRVLVAPHAMATSASQLASRCVTEEAGVGVTMEKTGDRRRRL